MKVIQAHWASLNLDRLQRWTFKVSQNASKPNGNNAIGEM